MELSEESDRATELLKGKRVVRVIRHRKEEVCVEFADGTRLYVDGRVGAVELSITGGDQDERGNMACAKEAEKAES